MLTEAQKTALRWFKRHNGDGCFDNTGVLLAAGERAPFTRGTWNALIAVGIIEHYHPAGSKRGRLRLAKATT